MDRDESDELVRRYLAHLEYVRLPSEPPVDREGMRQLLEHQDQLAETNPHEEAWDDLNDLIRREPSSAWPLMLEIIAKCQDEDLVTMGTGELESFFFWNGPAYAADIERQLRTNERFLRAFMSLYMGGVPESTWRHFNDVLADLGVPSEHLSEWWTDEELYPPSV